MFEDTSYLTVELEREKEKHIKAIETKEGNAYNTAVRKCVYYALEHQCPVDHVSNIVKFIAETFTGQSLNQMPHPVTITRMAREMGTISDIQAGSVLTANENCTPAFDATDIDGNHANEVHISANTSEGCRYMTLGLANLSGGTALDYTNHIMDSVRDVAESFAEWTGLDGDTLVKDAEQNISSTISDRAAVNHCVVESLKGHFGKDIVELNCNVHPLDSIASKARAVLKATGVKARVFWTRGCCSKCHQGPEQDAL